MDAIVRDSHGHRTRFSDSSLYDEVCMDCGATDASGDTRLREFCPDAIKEPSEKESAATAPIKSDGGSTDYYKLPEGATELNDLIEHKNMPFALGNIFKACYRLGEKSGTDIEYDINKIIFFAERLRGMVRKGQFGRN